jgi:Uma2 family endonuclease
VTRLAPRGLAALECQYCLAWWRTWQEEGTMNAMTAPDVWSGEDRMLTVEDMENMPDDEFRYELDDGILIASPAPSRLHQLAVTRLAVVLSAACPAEFVVLAGVGVNISKFQHRVPDVAVVRADGLETFFQETPPELVVEVAPPRCGFLLARTIRGSRSGQREPYQRPRFVRMNGL